MTMTPAEINASIAEACGWTVQLSRLEMGLDVVRHRERKTLPNYCGDLNAMHEAEKTLSETNMFVMAHHIERLVSKHGQHYFHATARQRAEAFLRTLGKWRD